MSKEYESKGIVIGNNWGGGVSGYAANQYFSNNKSKILKTLRENFKSGALDGGMGFESLIGAIVTVTTIETLIIKGKKFVARQDEEVRFGNKMTDSEVEFLEDCYY